MFKSIREACADVSARARFVKIRHDRLEPYVQGLGLELAAPVYDPLHHYLGEPEATLAYVVTLDAVNFGSGYFPHLRKRPGMSGYFTVASTLKDHFEQHGALTAAELCDLTPQRTAEIFEQDLSDGVRAELVRLFTQALNDLGSYLHERFGGSFVRLIESAEGRAEKLAILLAEMPYFQDVAQYGELSVPLYKRAQITPSDLSLAFEGKGYGAFDDLDNLTIFADNLVPHVLRVDGLLEYTPELSTPIDAGDLLPAGSPGEVEIRAVALHTVELIVDILRKQGRTLSAQQLDVALWNQGQDPKYKLLPRHRTRTVFY